jgi:hypothetical protein
MANLPHYILQSLNETSVYGQTHCSGCNARSKALPSRWQHFTLFYRQLVKGDFEESITEQDKEEKGIRQRRCSFRERRQLKGDF